MARRVDAGDDHARFELHESLTGHHHHLVCDVCGRVEDFHVPDEFEQQVAANPQGKHGKHEYALEEYGLDPDQVRERFAAYIERFQISA